MVHNFNLLLNLTWDVGLGYCLCKKLEQNDTLGLMLKHGDLCTYFWIMWPIYDWTI
jgi:hypothetical protein